MAAIICEYTGKVSYPSEQSAKRKIAKKNKSGSIHIYKYYICPKCLNYHITKSGQHHDFDTSEPSDIQKQINYHMRKNGFDK